MAPAGWPVPNGMKAPVGLSRPRSRPKGGIDVSYGEKGESGCAAQLGLIKIAFRTPSDMLRERGTNRRSEGASLTDAKSRRAAEKRPPAGLLCQSVEKSPKNRRKILHGPPQDSPCFFIRDEVLYIQCVSGKDD